MAKTEQQHREDIVHIGRLMYENGWIAANDGNISIRLGTASYPRHAYRCPEGHARPGRTDCLRYGWPQDFGRETAHYRDGHASDHLPLPRRCASRGPCASAHRHRIRSGGTSSEPGDFAGSHHLPRFCSAGRVWHPGTPALSEGMQPYVDKYDAMLLANHGAVAYGEDVFKAYARLETVEHVARITLVAELLGGPRVLPRVEIEKLFAARTRYGIKARNRFEPGAPLAAEDIPDPVEKIEMTREQLLSIIDEALRVRGVI